MFTCQLLYGITARNIRNDYLQQALLAGKIKKERYVMLIYVKLRYVISGNR